MIVLDTNIIAEFDRPRPNPAVIRWFGEQDQLELYLCTPVVLEQSSGAELFRLRTGSARYIRTRDRLLELFRNRVLDFSLEAAIRAGILRATREGGGRHMSLADAMIASICLVNEATLATRNTRDFEGIDLRLVNPFEAGA